jgi:hypothetical protein
MHAAGCAARLTTLVCCFWWRRIDGLLMSCGRYVPVVPVYPSLARNGWRIPSTTYYFTLPPQVTWLRRTVHNLPFYSTAVHNNQISVWLWIWIVSNVTGSECGLLWAMLMTFLMEITRSTRRSTKFRSRYDNVIRCGLCNLIQCTFASLLQRIHSWRSFYIYV